MISYLTLYLFHSAVLHFCQHACENAAKITRVTCTRGFFMRSCNRFVIGQNETYVALALLKFSISCCCVAECVFDVKIISFCVV